MKPPYTTFEVTCRPAIAGLEIRTSDDPAKHRTYNVQLRVWPGETVTKARVFGVWSHEDPAAWGWEAVSFRQVAP